jgi:hypothetical protein
MPNEAGINGYGEKNCEHEVHVNLVLALTSFIGPSDDVLTEFFNQLAYQYAGRGVPIEIQLELLKSKFGLEIRYVHYVVALFRLLTVVSAALSCLRQESAWGFHPFVLIQPPRKRSWRPCIEQARRIRVGLGGSYRHVED